MKKIGGGGHEVSGLYYLDNGDLSNLVALQLVYSPFQGHCLLDRSSLQSLKAVPSRRQVESL